MKEKRIEQSPEDEMAAFNRRFKYALIGFAIVEFFLLAAVVYYKASR